MLLTNHQSKRTATMDSPPSIAPVLYVEDDENDVYFIQYGFRKARVTQPLRIISNGQEAVDYLSGTGRFPSRDHHPLPCLMLLDLNLPLLSGMEVLEWMRQRSAFQDLPVVILTSSNQVRDQERARELGAADYLLKPTDLQHYVEMVEDLKKRWLNRCQD